MTVRFTNLKQFERDIKRFIKKTQIAPDTVARRLALSVFRGVVQRTPVDTGYARANWQMAKGVQPTGNPVPKPASGNVLPPPTPDNLPSTGIPVYWVVNNVPYIIPLENGHSKQMGRGYMVRRTLVAVQNEIRTILKELQ